jgi:hypothetical protein
MTTSLFLLAEAAISAPAVLLGNPLLLLPVKKGSKRKGLQLALEPLNGRGIAGYVPKP